MTRARQATILNREGGFFLLSNKAMEDLRDIEVDMSVLNPYTDKKQHLQLGKGCHSLCNPGRDLHAAGKPAAAKADW